MRQCQGKNRSGILIAYMYKKKMRFGTRIAVICLKPGGRAFGEVQIL